MQSDTTTIQHLFQDRRQYCVPFYQRAYVWTQSEQWAQLWDDIREKAEARLAKQKPTPHFLGAVVLDLQPREGLRGVDVLHIIDGQQRLTTLQFVLAAVLLSLQNKSNTEFVNIINPCVRNGNVDTMRNPEIEIYKVWPTFRDRDSFTRAIDAPTLPELKNRFQAHFTKAGELRKYGTTHPPSLAAIWFFARSFDSWLGLDRAQLETRAEALILAILHDLKVVSIWLEKDDDAQIIFETLNGRGAQLHATDLIRNFVFMRADRESTNSKSLYDRLWAQFENSYWNAHQTRGRQSKPRIEWLIHTTLQAELRDDIDLSRLYFEYRRYAIGRDEALTAERQLARLSDYAVHYKELVSGNGEMPIARFGRRIASYDITTIHPLAMTISISEAPDEAKDEMFSDLLSYIVRRAICGLTFKNYNNVFLAALRQLPREGLTPSALRAILGALSGDNSRWPSDAEFRNACLTAPLYYDRLEAPKMRAILTELEAELRKAGRPEEREIPSLTGLDIDHIMPRSWYKFWPLRDGTFASEAEATETSYLKLTGGALTERQQAIAKRLSVIPTLGNLSLLNLSVNREAQNYEFSRKRALLIENTTLRLNIRMIGLPAWDEDAIALRGADLANACLSIWKGPRP